LEFFVSYSERDNDFEQLVSQTLAPHGIVSGRASVETGGLELIRRWSAEREDRPRVAIRIISESYLLAGRAIADAVRETDSFVWINVYLENVERLRADLMSPGIPLEGLDRERATTNLEIYLDALLGDPDLFAPRRTSGSMGMTSPDPEPLSLGELLERRELAGVGRDQLVSALESPNFEVIRPRAHEGVAPPAASRPSMPSAQTLPLPQSRQTQSAADSRGGLIRWLVIGGALVLAGIALKDWLGHLLAGAAISQGMVQPVPSHTGPVDVSAFAAEGGAPGEKVLVQVLLHAEADLRRAVREARLADPGATRRMTATLTQEIAPGQLVTLMLEGDEVGVDEPVQRIVWRGRPIAAQFLVGLSARIGNTYLRCRLLVDNVPVGSLRFALRVSRDNVDPRVEMRGETARRHRRAFLSYASADRAEVLKRAQGLRAAGIDFFQDVLSLEPGEAWEQRLYDEIDRCDLFLLFWSSNAAKSEWVERETEHAIARQRATEGSPEITPVIIEGPPPAKPIPEQLRHMHFNDYVMLAAMSDARH